MILGLKCDLSVTLSLKPITNFITNAAEYISNVLGVIAPKDGIVFNGKFNCNNWRVKNMRIILFIMLVFVFYILLIMMYKKYHGKKITNLLSSMPFRCMYNVYA